MGSNFPIKKIKLSDICSDISYGYTASADVKNVGPKFLRITDIRGGIVSWDNVPYCQIEKSQMSKYLLKNGDIVVARTGNSTGENYIFTGEENAVFASYLIRFRVNEKEALPHFVWYQMRSALWWNFVNSSKTGSAQAGANAKVLGEFELFLPALSIQIMIVSVLQALDNSITHLRITNTTLEAIAQALFKSWFVDFDPVRAKAEGRQPEGMDAETAALFPDSFENSELGLIPKGWSTTAVYDLGGYINGAAYRAFEPNEEKKGLPIIKIAELKSGVTTQTRYSAVNMPEKYKINNGDILFSWSGNPDTSIDTFVWIYDSAWLNQHIFRVVPRVEQDRSFVLMTLKHLRPVFAEIARNKQTTGLGHVTVADLKRLKLVRPSKPILDSWNEIVAPLLEQVFIGECRIRSLVALRDTLLPRLISGQLQIPNDTVTAEHAK